MGIERITEVYELGVQAAKILAPGDSFTGAFGAARECGIIDMLEREIFTIAFLNALAETYPNGVTVDHMGRILR